MVSGAFGFFSRNTILHVYISVTRAQTVLFNSLIASVHTSYFVFKEMGHEVSDHLFQAMTCFGWTVMNSFGGGIGLILGLPKKCCAVSPGFISYSYVMKIKFF